MKLKNMLENRNPSSVMATLGEFSSASLKISIDSNMTQKFQF